MTVAYVNLLEPTRTTQNLGLSGNSTKIIGNNTYNIFWLLPNMRLAIVSQFSTDLM